jgi:hypothetical protein
VSLVSDNFVDFEELFRLTAAFAADAGDAIIEFVIAHAGVVLHVRWFGEDSLFVCLFFEIAAFF